MQRTFPLGQRAVNGAMVCLTASQLRRLVCAFHPSLFETITYLPFPFTDLVTCFCPCITYGEIKRRYEHLNSTGTPDTEQGGICNNDCMLNGCLHLTCRASVILEVGHPFYIHVYARLPTLYILVYASQDHQ